MLCEPKPNEHVVSDEIRFIAEPVNDALYPEIECMLEVPACTTPKSSASTGPSLPRLQVPYTSTRLACVAECGRVLDVHAVCKGSTAGLALGCGEKSLLLCARARRFHSFLTCASISCSRRRRRLLLHLTNPNP